MHNERHCPEQTTLYRPVQQPVATVVAYAEDAAGADLPQFVKCEFDSFLACGIWRMASCACAAATVATTSRSPSLASGAAFAPRAAPGAWGQTAAHLVDNVSPHVPCASGCCPCPSPAPAAGRATKLVTPVLQVVHSVITRHHLKQAGLEADGADSSAVTLIQRFGSAANLNIHLHRLVLDGVYRRGADGAPEFVEVPAPTDAALQAVLHKMITGVMKLLTGRGC